MRMSRRSRSSAACLCRSSTTTRGSRVARILGDGKRKRTRVFSELVSHYLFEDRFGRPGKGNDKGKVEGMVGYTRRNFMVPKPRFASFDDLNAHLAEQCRKRMGDKLRGHMGTIGERFAPDALNGSNPCQLFLMTPATSNLFG